MNSKMMVKSFMDCIRHQSNYPKYFIVEHGNENYCNLDDGFDMGKCIIMLHKMEDVGKVLEMKIVGFTFGENCRPIVLDETLNEDCCKEKVV